MAVLTINALVFAVHIGAGDFGKLPFDFGHTLPMFKSIKRREPFETT